MCMLLDTPWVLACLLWCHTQCRYGTFLIWVRWASICLLKQYCSTSTACTWALHPASAVLGKPHCPYAQPTTRNPVHVLLPCLRLQDYVSELTNRRNRIKVDALLFAPPNVGDATFAAAFGTAINARRIPFLNDLIPQVPCTPNMIGCKNAVVPTGTNNNRGLWAYASVPGTLMLLPANMPQQAQAWSLFGKIHPCQIGRFLRATHICSYNCYLSQFIGDTNNLCQLWNTTTAAGSGAATGSYCFQFPVPSGPKYPYV